MIDEIVSRLEANKGALGLKVVGGASEFGVAAETNPTAYPAAYVIQLKETPGENPFSGACVQRTRIDVGICIAVRNVADAKGEAAGKDMRALRKLIKDLLLNWSPADGDDPLERGPCNLLGFKPGGVMWWQDSYFSTYTDRSVL